MPPRQFTQCFVPIRLRKLVCWAAIDDANFVGAIPHHIGRNGTDAFAMDDKSAFK